MNVSITCKFDDKKEILSFYEDDNNSLPTGKKYLKNFSFKVERHKDPDTHVESLTITCLDNGNDNGVIETSISNIRKALQKFQRFGLVLLAPELEAVSFTIMSEYHSLPLVPAKTEQVSQRIEDFLTEIGVFIYEDRDKKGELPLLCNIPVQDFDETAIECGYMEYELTELRRHLKDRGFIRTTSDKRFSVLVRRKDKPIRAIQFIRDKIVKYLPQDAKNEDTATSDTNDK